MTHIKGEIIKTGYSQVSSGTGGIIDYTFGGIVPGSSTVSFDLPPEASTHKRFLYSIIISSDDLWIQRVYLIQLPENILLKDLYFGFTSPCQYSLGEIEIPLNSIVRVYLENNDPAPAPFVGSILWKSVPI